MALSSHIPGETIEPALRRTGGSSTPEWLWLCAVTALVLASCTPGALPSAEVTALRLPAAPPIIVAAPTPYYLDQLIHADLPLSAGPVDLPLALVIPALGINAPILGVGLTAQNRMDAPKGAIGDAVWHSAFWYRGGGNLGAIGTATIAAHVNDPLGVPEIFAKLHQLRPGDEIIVHVTQSGMDITFIVDEVIMYSTLEALDPAILIRIFGAGPVAGQAALPAVDGLSYLTLITCAGYIVDGTFDHHTVVYATRSD